MTSGDNIFSANPQKQPQKPQTIKPAGNRKIINFELFTGFPPKYCEKNNREMIKNNQ
jgi:hypothetical protein